MKMSRKPLSLFVAIMLMLTTLLGLMPTTFAAAASGFKISADIAENSTIEAGTKININWSKEKSQSFSWAYKNPQDGIRTEYKDSVTEKTTRVEMKEGTNYTKTFDKYISSLGDVTYTKLNCAFTIDTTGQEAGEHTVTIYFCHGEQDVTVGTYSYVIKGKGDSFKVTVDSKEIQSGATIKSGDKLVIDWAYASSQISFNNNATRKPLEPYVVYKITGTKTAEYEHTPKYTAQKSNNSRDVYSNLSDSYTIDTSKLSAGTYTLTVRFVHGEDCDNQSTHNKALFGKFTFIIEGEVTSEDISFKASVDSKEIKSGAEVTQGDTIKIDWLYDRNVDFEDTYDSILRDPYVTYTVTGPSNYSKSDKQYQKNYDAEKIHESGFFGTSYDRYSNFSNTYDIDTTNLAPGTYTLAMVLTHGDSCGNKNSHKLVLTDASIYGPFQFVIVPKAPDTVTVTYKANEHGAFGQANTTQNVINKGDKFTEPTATLTVNDGYVFTGWNTDAAGTGTTYVAGTTVVNESITVYAQYRLKKFTVKLHSNAADASFPGTTDDPMTFTNVEYGTTVTAISSYKAPVRANYTPDGWMTSAAAGSTKVTTITGTDETEEIHLYSDWDENAFVIFDAGDYGYLNGDSAKTGVKVYLNANNKVDAVPTVTVKDSYATSKAFAETWTGNSVDSTFGTKAITANETVLKSGATYKANYNNKYTVNFYKPEQSTPVDTKYFEAGKNLELANTPQYNSLTFLKWVDSQGTEYTAQSIVNSNLDLYAVYKVTLTFHADSEDETVNGSFTGDKETIEVETDTNTKIAKIDDVPTAAAKVFSYWNKKNASSEFAFGVTKPTDNMDFYANYNVKKIKVTLVPDGGTFEKNNNTSTTDNLVFENTNKVAVGTALTSLYKKITKENYEFIGWENTSNAIVENVEDEATQDAGVTYTAKWRPIVTFNTLTDGQFGQTTPAVKTKKIPVTTEAEAPYVYVTNDTKKFVQWVNVNDPTDTLDEGDSLAGITAPKTYKAEYTAKTYKVILYENKSSSDTAKQVFEDVPYGTKIVEITGYDEPSFAGHSFSAWMDAQSSGNTVTAIEGNLVSGKPDGATIKLWADWDTVQYTITYNPLSNGTLPNKDKGATNEEIVNAGNKATYTDEPTPDDPGYVFDCWKNGETRIEDITNFEPTEDVELKACYKLKKFTVILYANGGQYSSATETSKTYNNVEYGTTINAITGYAEPTYAGHSFSSWKNAATSGTTVTAITGDLVSEKNDSDTVELWADWDTVQYTITYLPGDGTFNKEPDKEEEIVDAGDPAQGVEPPTPDDEDSVFDCWNDGEEDIPDITEYVPEGDVTLTAKYRKKLYTVNLYANGGKYENALVIVTTYNDVKAGTDVVDIENYVEPTYDKHSLVGWMDQATDGEAVLTLTGYDDQSTINLYADWLEDEDEKVQITLDANGGCYDLNPEKTTVSAEAYEGMSAARLKKPDARCGYVFKGYSYTKDGTEPIDTISLEKLEESDNILYAIWEKKDVPCCKLLTLHGNGGFFELGLCVKIVELKPGENPAAVYAAPTRPGFRFVGWYDKNGQLVEILDEDTTELFAHWEAIEEEEHVDPEEKQPEGWQGFHEDEPEAVEPAAEPVAEVPALSPQTDDSMNIALYLALALMAVAAGVFAAKKLRKQN